MDLGAFHPHVLSWLLFNLSICYWGKIKSKNCMISCETRFLLRINTFSPEMKFVQDHPFYDPV